MKITTTAAEREEKTYKKPNIHIWIPYSTAVCTWITLLANTSHISIQQSTEQSPEKKKNFIWVSIQGILHESTNLGHYFYVSNWKQDRHFTWSSEPREGLAACTAKGVPSFLSYFKTWVLNWPRKSNPPPPALQSSANPAVLKRLHFDILRWL